jgi:hypothetical protein
MFDNSAGGIELQGGSSGPAATNLAITNNVISKPGQWTQTTGAISMIGVGADGNILSTPVFQKLKITNNLIEDAPGLAILATSTDYFQIGPTSIIDSNQIQSSPATFGTLPTLDSILVYESSDGVVCGTEMAGQTTGPIGIDPTDRRVPVAPNCP